MYVCKHCGYISHNDSINYCNNIRCRFYGCNDKSCYDKKYDQNHKDNNANQREDMPHQKAMSFMRGQPHKMQTPNPMPNQASTQKPTQTMPMFNPMNMNMHNIPMPPMNQMSNPMNMPSDKNALGFATVPFQEFDKMLPFAELFQKGTLFPELDMPYTEKIIRRG